MIFVDLNNGLTYNGDKPYIHWFDDEQSTNLNYVKKICFLTDTSTSTITLNKNDIFIHGHFHVPMLKKEGDIYIANPNSISLPKQGEASYIIYENHTLTMYRLSDDTIIDTLNLE